MTSGCTSSAVAAAFGLPVRNGSTSTLTLPSESSKQLWPRKRMSIGSVLLGVVEQVGELQAGGHADEHGQTRLLRQQRAHGRLAGDRVLRSGRLADLVLVRLAEPRGLLQRLVEDALQLGRLHEHEALGGVEASRLRERLDGGLHFRVGVVASVAHPGGHYKDDMAVALTSLSHGAGCGCKISATDLRPTVAALPRSTDPRVLVGSETADDAGVFRSTDDLALVQTVDFFTPIVDDPYAFGRIAATNALSDVYAMGATPVTCLNLVAYPIEQLGPELLGEILRGGAEAAAEAGASVVGGHSIDDPKPKYGMAVTGTAHPERLLTNAGGRAGDALVLTKPLGAGAVATAVKRGHASVELVERAIEVMTTLNATASRQALAAG